MKKMRFLKRVLLLDNYDSFTYNLKHYLSGLGIDVVVVRNNEFDHDLTSFSHIVLSPGPGLPKDAGCMPEIIRQSAGKIPILGVCLGMQAIGEFLGGKLYNLPNVKHGVQEEIQVEKSILFPGMEKAIQVGLYHSWAVDEKGNYRVTARSNSGVVMALESDVQKMFGVQFHPESIMTDYGKEILSNFIATN